MIPILSLANFLNALISTYSAGRILVAYRKHPSDALRYFLFFYISFAFYWFWWSFPGIFTRDLRVILATNILGYLFSYLSFMTIVQIPLIFLGKTGWRVFAAFVVGGAGAFFVIARLYHPEFPTVEIIAPYIYWRPMLQPLWLRPMTGVVGGSVALIAIGMFWHFGNKNKTNQRVYYKSIHLVLGMSLLFVAALVAFIVSPGASFIANTAGSLLVISGLLVMLRGILYDQI